MVSLLYINSLAISITNSFLFTQKEKEFLINKIVIGNLPFSLAEEIFMMIEKQNIFLETYFKELLSFQ